jgi:hypothetical protein
MPPPAPPAAPPFPGFTEPQKSTIGGLSGLLLALGPIFLLLAIARVALGVVEIVRGSWLGLFHLPEAAIIGFIGLVMITAWADANYLRTVPGREKEHLLNTYTSLNVAYTALLILGSCLAVVYLFRIFM